MSVVQICKPVCFLVGRWFISTIDSGIRRKPCDVMNTPPAKSDSNVSIEIAGDVCLDVVAVPIAPPVSISEGNDNWRQTGETRTHFLPGGVLLLQHWIALAAQGHGVSGPRPCLPSALACGNTTVQPLTTKEFLNISERLARDEVVHSLVELTRYPVSPGTKDCDVLRVLATHGFSGPKKKDPSLEILPPESKSSPQITVLDDTGNRFRRTPSQWPASLRSAVKVSDGLVIHKLHRPLPDNSAPEQEGGTEGSAKEKKNLLWRSVKANFPERRIVIVSIDDLRNLDVPISRGLSWERTALDLVWQLLNAETFAELRDCPHLIVRFGLNGAVYWHCRQPTEPDGPKYLAWLIYNPAGIEGYGEKKFDGQMVGYGSAFTAALTGCVATAIRDSINPGMISSPGKALSDEEKMDPSKWVISPVIESGIRAGLLASRRLLIIGYGTVKSTSLADSNKKPANPDVEPAYPDEEMFQKMEGDPSFACQPIPIIPGAVTADRGYWRLLDSIFEGKTKLLHKAVSMTATGANAIDTDDKEAASLLKQVPIAEFAKALRTYDRREIENYRALYSLMQDYTHQVSPPRPLSIAVFGPPGAGKSFGVKYVAKELSQQGGLRPIETLTFNLSQYETPQQLADAFHLIRDLVLKGKIPLVFFDEFDSAMAGVRLGWLRYFLAPMQDAEFLDKGTPHPIGQAIFVFAGGTCSSYAEFAKPFLSTSSDDDAKTSRQAFKAAKGPDFLSRLRGTLDIPGLDLHTLFDPFGPVDAFPCEAAILLRRAGILAHQLGEKAPQLRNSAKTLQVSQKVLRALLHLPKFVHGNRSFEALLDMSSLSDAEKFTPSRLPSPAHAELHADSRQLSQLLQTEYPFPTKAREIIAQAIHESYVEGRKQKEGTDFDPSHPSVANWPDLTADLKESNREQADHIAIKLRIAGLWFRKRMDGTSSSADASRLQECIERLAIVEHDRWVAEKRRKGWIAGDSIDEASRNNSLLRHNCLFTWEQLTDDQRKLDIDTVEKIPNHLAKAGYEIVKL